MLWLDQAMAIIFTQVNIGYKAVDFPLAAVKTVSLSRHRSQSALHIWAILPFLFCNTTLVLSGYMGLVSEQVFLSFATNSRLAWNCVCRFGYMLGFIVLLERKSSPKTQFSCWTRSVHQKLANVWSRHTRETSSSWLHSLRLVKLFSFCHSSIKISVVKISNLKF